MQWGRHVTCFHQSQSPGTSQLHVPPQIVLPEILLNILDLYNHRKTLFRALVWYFVRLQCDLKGTILRVETGFFLLCESPAMRVGSHRPCPQRLLLLPTTPRAPGRLAAAPEVRPSQRPGQPGTCGPWWRHEFLQTLRLSSEPLLKHLAVFGMGTKWEERRLLLFLVAGC